MKLLVCADLFSLFMLICTRKSFTWVLVSHSVIQRCAGRVSLRMGEMRDVIETIDQLSVHMVLLQVHNVLMYIFSR